jgi:hypothetical protein
MDAAPGAADWLTWWSWPWRAMNAWASPAVSLAPQALSQPILPGWVFGTSINVTEQNSSSPETERAVVSEHSYGQQLGRIIDVVGELVRQQPAGALDPRSVRDFTEMSDDIDTIKARLAATQIRQAIARLADLKQRHPDEYRQLAAELEAVLAGQEG